MKVFCTMLPTTPSLDNTEGDKAGHLGLVCASGTSPGGVGNGLNCVPSTKKSASSKESGSSGQNWRRGGFSLPLSSTNAHASPISSGGCNNCDNSGSYSQQDSCTFIGAASGMGLESSLVRSRTDDGAGLQGAAALPTLSVTEPELSAVLTNEQPSTTGFDIKLSASHDVSQRLLAEPAFFGNESERRLAPGGGVEGGAAAWMTVFCTMLLVCTSFDR